MSLSDAKAGCLRKPGRFDIKKILLFILIFFLFGWRCTEKTYNYYLEVEKGSLTGVVEPAGSGARVSAWQAREVAFTFIDSTGYFIIPNLTVGTYSIKVEAEGYTTYESKPDYTVYGGGTTTVGTIALSPFPDLISSVYPPDKATDVSIWTNIRIIFRDGMNKESVTNAFSITPPTEGTFYWIDKPGRYIGTVLEFHSAYNLLYNTVYNVELGTTAQDTAGNHLMEPFSFSFTTAGVGVERFSPADGQTDVGTSIYISIYFTTVMDRQSVEEAFSIDPPTSGSFNWGSVGSKPPKKLLDGSADRLWFEPDNYLKTNTMYRVTLETTAKDTGGIPIPEPLSFSFTTEDLRVSRTSPNDGDMNSRLSSGITVYFNTSMNNSATEDAFSIQPSIDGNFFWTSNSTSFNFKPQSEYLAANTEYEIKIDTTASDIYDSHLSESYSFSFTTEEINLSSYPNDNSTGVSTKSYVRVSFNTAMDQSSIIDAFSITPFVEGGVVWSSNRQFTFVPDQVLVPNTLYTIGIDSSVQDSYGMKLKHSYSFSFTTDEIRITSTYPENRATYVGLNTIIEIVFNTDMDQASVVSAFRMTGSDSVEIGGECSWYYSNLTYLRFYPDSSLAPNEEYTVTIGTEATDIWGVNMPEEFVLWFKTCP